MTKRTVSVITVMIIRVIVSICQVILAQKNLWQLKKGMPIKRTVEVRQVLIPSKIQSKKEKFHC
jgi:hypothetical protein